MEEIFIYPQEGLFDLSKIERHLSRIPFTSRDPVGDSNVFLACGSDEQLSYALSIRRANPEGSRPFVGIVQLQPDVVIVGQICNELTLKSLRGFVEWMLKDSPCRLVDDYGFDWTESVYKQGFDELYASDDDD